MSVLIRPIVSEKASAFNEVGKYCFVVENKATKIEIQKDVAKEYNVSVVSVNTINVMGKRKTRYTKKGFITGRRSSYKKAIVQVKEGDIIDFYNKL